MLERPIYLIGMSGSGKSTLGRRAAASLHLPYRDMDQTIAEIFSMPVTEIFARHGEEAFRRAETNLLIHLSTEKPGLISTGGGTVIQPVNREIMKCQGVILLVDRPLENILGDIKLDRRPLLAEKGLGEVERLYRERIDIYRSAADIVVHNDGSFDSGLEALTSAITSRFRL